MVSVEFTDDELLGLVALGYIGLTHNYDTTPDAAVRKDQEILYLSSIVSIQGMSEEAFRNAIMKLDTLREMLVKPEPESEPTTE